MIRHKGCLAEIMHGDCMNILQTMRLSDFKIQTCITSPPYYGLRDYGCSDQIGLEPTPENYILNLLNVFRLVRNIMEDDGTLWINIGDSYAGSGKGRNSNRGTTTSRLNKTPIGNCKPKDLLGIPWMLAFALRNDGWYLRQDIIWAKPNPMPESVRDRCTRSHEYLFLLSKSKNYYFDSDAIRTPRKSDENANGFRGGSYCNNSTFNNSEGGKRTSIGNIKFKDSGARDRTNGKYRNPGTSFQPHTGLENPYTTANKRDVWTVSPTPYKQAHFATFPAELIKPCVLAGSRPKDIVLDPFAGSGTTAGVALAHGRNALMLELNPNYVALMPDRIQSIIDKEQHK